MKLPMHQCFLISSPCQRVQPGSATALRPPMPIPLQCLTCPQETKQSPSGEEEEGGLLPPCCSALLVASRASPSAGAVASVLQWCGHPCAPPCWWRAPCTAPQKGRVRRMLPPAKSPSDSCLASFGRGAAHCPYSSIFPAAVRLASMYKLYLSLSVCRGRILSKEGRSLQAAPKLGYNSKQIQ